MDYELFTLSDGRKLSYRIVGDPAHHPVVYLHGFGSSSAVMVEDRDVLTDLGLFVIAVDRPGYGRSDLHPGYSSEDFAEDIYQLLSCLGIKRCAVAGWSTGGMFAQDFARLYPQYVSSLTLLGSVLPLSQPEVERIMPVKWKFVRWVMLHFPGVCRYLFKRVSKRINQDIDHAVMNRMKKMVRDDKEAAMLFTELLKKATYDAYQYEGMAVYYEVLAMCKADFEVRPGGCYPTMIWQGEDDHLWTVSTSRFLKQRYTKSRMFIIKDKGHFMFLSIWRDVLQLIKDVSAPKEQNQM
ncbi:alpha/beta fold hydrolase [Peribacillus deserti]|uniref:AB hydrolase-1 domain-containing protein n=1 Tax=Peribacillus deserti TaxID=673318 RepID=A0A2N5MC34_9BACI|nr:alpha/beta hydrolase [Peribacillus deserti]PLT31916.1 hypothetical protein CUU66_00355 [Peribacillus deserti]